MDICHVMKFRINDGLNLMKNGVSGRVNLT